MSRHLERLSPMDHYTVASQESAGRIIGSYSTSFGLATRLLAPDRRRHIRNLYALVRVADELVDGVAGEARLSADAQREALDALEAQTDSAVVSGYSSNPIVHAFAHTARLCGIGSDLTGPFFASMRMDVEGGMGAGAAPSGAFDDRAHGDYVYGSAEVVGLMCLRVFVAERTYSTDQIARLERGARSLGAAFQNVNFLRDLADDTTRLGRHYLGERGRLDTAARDRWLGVIRAQLDDARATLPLLPADARLAVGAALRLFSALASRIARTPVEDLYRRRVRVSGVGKTLVLTGAVLDLRQVRVG